MDSMLALLARWMPRQRWYSSKGTAPRLRMLADLEMPSPEGGIRVRVLIVVDESATPPVTYQVPVVERRAGEAPTDHLIGRLAEEIAVIDGPHDGAYTSALIRAVGVESPSLPGVVLAGEQSNTSIIFGGDDANPVICKIFRQLNPGLNPDIELQTALARAGSPHVPRAFGHIEATWPDPGGSDQDLTGSLAFAQEFLPGVEDAWRVALRSAGAGESFTASAHALGAATADVHLSLAHLFDTADPDDQARAAVSTAWRRRLTIAITEVPELQRHRESIAAVYARALDAQWPPLQRIHGDYHLGQVLHVPGRGWVLLDFEGEPMRPIRERLQPDSALRDVAGMLRSFDYVEGSLRAQGEDASDDDQATVGARREWARQSRQAFLGGYEHRSGRPTTGPLLDAFELDKAVYEAIYEARNRPAWLGIPLTAIDRLISPR